MKRKPPLPQTPKQYIQLQKQANLQINDTVLITRKATDYEMGWGTRWAPNMDSTIKELVTIVDIDPEFGPLLNTSAGKWYYPYFVLEKQ